MSILNEATVPRMTDSLCNMWSMLVVGPIYLAISATAPFNDQIILSQTTASWWWSLMHQTSWYKCSKDTSVFLRSEINTEGIDVGNVHPQASHEHAEVSDIYSGLRGFSGHCMAHHTTISSPIWNSLPHHLVWLHCCPQEPLDSPRWPQ